MHTCTHAYLMPSSCHPTHVCKNIPKGVMKRVKRNCTEEDLCNEGFTTYKQHLVNRGYDSTLIDTAIDDARATPREVLVGLDQKKKGSAASSKRFPLVVKFNPRLPPMSKFIHKHLHVLELTEQTKQLFNKSSIFVSYRMERNILSMITNNKFKDHNLSQPVPAPPPHIQPPDDPSWGCQPCPKKCTLCNNYLQSTKTFTSPKTCQSFKIRSHIDCNTKNVIYLILDLKCNDIFYIGYTTDSMAVRWRNHKSHIKKGIKSCELASHFIALSNSTHKIDQTTQPIFTSQLAEHLAVIIIESVKPRIGLDVEAFLKEREDFWQGALKSTPLFGGINKRNNKTRNKKS